MDWVETIGDFEVEQKEIPRPGGKPYFLNGSTLIGVLHTTEGSTVAGAWSTLSQSHSAPHFIAGQNRIVQCRPLSVQAAALRPGPNNTANVHAQVQIEMVGLSQKQLWMPDEGTLHPTVAILSYCRNVLGIPLRAPNNWPDDCSDLKKPWDSENERRLQAAQGLWPVEKGWWMHMEIPHQDPSWHWDCGAVRRSVLLEMAAQ